MGVVAGAEAVVAAGVAPGVGAGVVAGAGAAAVWVWLPDGTSAIS